MKQAYRTRPEDFKRRILKTGIESKKDLFGEEYKWLSKIKPSELKTRYYNLHNHHYGHWSANEQSTLSVGQKISRARKGKPIKKRGFILEEHKRKISESQMGKVLSEEHKRKISDGLSGHQISTETRKKISSALVGLKRGPMSEEQKQLRRKPKSEETKRKISEAMKKTLNKEKVLRG
jgi:hypothetical protein